VVGSPLHDPFDKSAAPDRPARTPPATELKELRHELQDLRRELKEQRATRERSEPASGARGKLREDAAAAKRPERERLRLGHD